jgi:hypothetical protein
MVATGLPRMFRMDRIAEPVLRSPRRFHPDLRARHAALDQARGVLVPEVVPPQVDLAEGVFRFPRQALVLQARGALGPTVLRASSWCFGHRPGSESEFHVRRAAGRIAAWVHSQPAPPSARGQSNQSSQAGSFAASPATIASTAASKFETGESGRVSVSTCAANFGQLANPCSRATKNCTSASRHRARRSSDVLNVRQRRSILYTGASGAAGQLKAFVTSESSNVRIQ